MSNGAEPAITVENLVKHYGSVHAVDGVSFAVPRATIFGLLGRNGAGKSTTTEMVAGLREPDRGRICVLGLDMASRADALKR